MLRRGTRTWYRRLLMDQRSQDVGDRTQRDDEKSEHEQALKETER